jgi:hypothetical protein
MPPWLRRDRFAKRFPPPSRNIGSKETAMPTAKFDRITLVQRLVSGCAILFTAYVLIEHAQAQPGYVPPPTPLPPPVFNPSNPGTVPQPPYTPITPTTPSTTPSTPSPVPSGEVTSPANEEPPSTTARSERQTSVAKTRSVHHHRGRSTLVTYSCGYLGCVRTYGWAFPCQYYSRYCYPYDYYRPYVPLYGYAGP